MFLLPESEASSHNSGAKLTINSEMTKYPYKNCTDFRNLCNSLIESEFSGQEFSEMILSRSAAEWTPEARHFRSPPLKSISVGTDWTR